MGYGDTVRTYVEGVETNNKTELSNSSIRKRTVLIVDQDGKSRYVQVRLDMGKVYGNRIPKFKKTTSPLL